MPVLKCLLALCLLNQIMSAQSEENAHRLFKRQSRGSGLKITELSPWTLPRKNVKQGDINKVERFRLQAPGITVEVASLDLIITSIKVPNQNKTMSDIILGFDDIAGYLESPSFSGAFVSLSPKGMQSENKTPRNWRATKLDDALVFSLLQGKKVLLNARFSLSKDELRVEMKGIVSEPTFLSIGLKNYFNLAGYETGLSGIEGHIVQINGNEISEKNRGSTKYVALDGHELDFRVPQSVEEVIYKDSLKYGRDFIVERSISEFDRFVGRVSHADSRRFLEVYSNQPVLHFDLLGETDAEGKESTPMEKNGGFVVKMATLLDDKEISSVNPGQIYSQTLVYKFGVDQF
uniref:Galactose mutarotase n=1 Tax=Caligus rogercresseyi TaxID=217165 RepID=C1BPZ4_CALRO|nr:Aldose 1-epimerase [Caligus rogercresseyi]